jgi:hypothetical protein
MPPQGSEELKAFLLGGWQQVGVSDGRRPLRRAPSRTVRTAFVVSSLVVGSTHATNGDLRPPAAASTPPRRDPAEFQLPQGASFATTLPSPGRSAGICRYRPEAERRSARYTRPTTARCARHIRARRSQAMPCSNDHERIPDYGLYFFRKNQAKRAALQDAAPGSGPTHLTLDRRGRRTFCGLRENLVKPRKEDFAAGRCEACERALERYAETGALP